MHPLLFHHKLRRHLHVQYQLPPSTIRRLCSTIDYLAQYYYKQWQFQLETAKSVVIIVSSWVVVKQGEKCYHNSMTGETN
ncbi:hypothetical protein HKD37_08G022267 [Glycine soja]|nr:hypothetical protein GmHk_08G022598 [Glycine max]